MEDKMTDEAATVNDGNGDNEVLATVDVELPEWLMNNVPTPRTPGIIKYEESTGTFIYVPSDPDTETKSFGSTEEAYDYAESTGEDFTFEGDFPDCETIFSGMLSTRTKDGAKGRERFARLMIASTDDNKLQSLKYHYKNFLDLAESYRANPDDFMTAYAFVRSHPAMWIKDFHPRDTAEVRNAPTYRWNTDNSDIWCEPMRDDNGVIRWALETGGHTPEYTERYHDMRLDVWNETIEGAYIDLAAKVHKFFHDNGTERENVEYTKSNLELLLEARLKEVEEDYAEDDSDEG